MTRTVRSRPQALPSRQRSLGPLCQLLVCALGLALGCHDRIIVGHERPLDRTTTLDGSETPEPADGDGSSTMVPADVAELEPVDGGVGEDAEGKETSAEEPSSDDPSSAPPTTDP